ncbi:MAG TPA: hypothetical protein VKX49_17750 [Bryobacteraceae bacterium]|nr:hypothetical protein [Bryobacteraceae bacterium]
MVRLIVTVGFIGIMVAGVFAADTNIQSPLTGLVFDGTAVRPIVGWPGASVLGDRIDLGFDAVAVQFNFAKDFGVAIDGSSAKVMLLRGVRSGRISSSAIGQTTADSIELNSAGTAGVLVSKSNATVQIVNGLPDAPVFSQTISFSAVGYPLTAVDADDAGASILAGFSDGNHGEVDRFDSAGGRSILSAAGYPSAVRYANTGKDAVIADSATNQVILIRDVQGLKEQLVAASGSDVVGTLAMRVWNGQLLVACPGAHKVIQVDLSQPAVVGEFDIPVAPSRVDGLVDAQTFLVTDVGSAPSYILRMSGQPATYFIPASPAQVHIRPGHLRE